MDDTFTTPQRRGSAETKVQGSRFLGVAVPVNSRTEVEAVLESVRKEYFDATHHCYAYRLGGSGDVYRMHDDGEPGGTGGRPILAAIDREGLTDILVLVTRYFGGVKLGVGGLGRAYGEAAAKAIHEAGRQTRYITGRLSVRFPHDQTNGVMHVVSSMKVHILETTYEDEVLMLLEIRLSMVEDLRRQLIQQTGGRAAVAPGDAGGEPA